MKDYCLKLIILLFTLGAFSGCEKLDRLRAQAEENDDSIIGSIFGNRIDVPDVQVAKSFDDYAREANNGSDHAQFVVAEKYYYGEGVPRDYNEAVKWYLMAGRQGHLESQFNLGRIYFRGKGAAKDLVESYAWVNVAASQGHERAASSREKLESRLTTYEITRAQNRSRELFEQVKGAKSNN